MTSSHRPIRTLNIAGGGNEVRLGSIETRLMREKQVRGQRYHSPKARQKSRKAW